MPDLDLDCQVDCRGRHSGREGCMYLARRPDRRAVETTGDIKAASFRWEESAAPSGREQTPAASLSVDPRTRSLRGHFIPNESLDFLSERS